MNLTLREVIVKHVLANFAIIPSAHLSIDKSKSLQSKEYLLSDKVSFMGLEDEVIQNKLWGCQVSVEQQEIKILLANCTIDINCPEYALLVHLKDQPLYGLYLVNNNSLDHEALIAVSMNGKEWLECSTYLQATFLAGMEQLKDLGFAWNKCTSYKEQLVALLSFIKFHNDIYGDKDEG